MSRYRITIDGKVYEMEVELIDGSNSVSGQDKPSVPTSSGAMTRSDVRVIDPSVHTETHVRSNAVMSPMPGTVVAVLVGPGETVSKGQTVLVLEAMKMENDIPAPKDGTIAKLFVGEGQTVQGGAPLFEMA